MEHQQQYPLACKDIAKKHYMDDYLGGADTDGRSINLIQNVMTVHSRAGFQMCNWICISKNVLQHINQNTNRTMEKEITDELKEKRTYIGTLD